VIWPAHTRSNVSQPITIIAEPSAVKSQHNGITPAESVRGVLPESANKGPLDCDLKCATLSRIFSSLIDLGVR
jgi:hypothetical protein